MNVRMLNSKNRDGNKASHTVTHGSLRITDDSCALTEAHVLPRVFEGLGEVGRLVGGDVPQGELSWSFSDPNMGSPFATRTVGENEVMAATLCPQ